MPIDVSNIGGALLSFCCRDLQRMKVGHKLDRFGSHHDILLTFVGRCTNTDGLREKTPRHTLDIT